MCLRFGNKQYARVLSVGSGGTFASDIVGFETLSDILGAS